MKRNRLAAYLDGGGRLLFSSQDFLYNHLINNGGNYGAFARAYLGVESHTEDDSSLITVGEPNNPVGSHIGPFALSFPPGYNNWTDSLTPTATARAMTLGQDGQPNGLTHAGSSGMPWHTNFLSYGPELLSTPDRGRLMQRSMGWLSWLGSSSVTPHTTAALDGTTVTYTVMIKNNGWADLPTTYFTATFPAELQLNSASPALSPVGGELLWNGPLSKNQSEVFTYTATISGSLPIGCLVSQTSWFYYPAHNILFDRAADVYVNFPKLDGSSIIVSPAENVQAGNILDYTVTLRNDGLVDNPMVTTTNTLPPMLNLVSLGTPSQGTIQSGSRSFTWTTPLSKNATATLSFSGGHQLSDPQRD